MIGLQKTKRLLIPALLALALLLALAALAVPVRAADWSGSGKYEDPYLIGTAEQLEALAASVNKGSSYTYNWFRLTADIEVSDWTPIGYDSSKTFAGYFDGDGFTVTINGVASAGKSNLGLFGYVYGGVVMNTTVDGEIEGAYVNGSTYYAGGIAGRLGSKGADQPGVIINCVNRARIVCTTEYASPSTYAGGIVGEVNGKFSQVNNCYNDGEVVSSKSAGGIVGYGNGGQYSYCYSAVVPTEGKDGYTGGISGGKNYGTETECYDAKTWDGITDSAAWLAAADAVSVTLNTGSVSGEGFWTLDADGKPVPKTCEHTPAGEGIVTPVTCTTDGYTTYTCSKCGRTYKEDVIVAPGHDYKTVTTEPTCTEAGKTVQTCSRCNSTIETPIPALGHELGLAPTKTADGWTHYCARCASDVLIPREVRHGAMDLVGVSAEITDPESYAWIYNAETGELESTNQKKNSTSSRLTVTLRSDKPFTLQFTYGVWSEPGDKLYVYVNGETIVEGAAGIISGADRWDETIEPISLEAGEYVLSAVYTKNDLYVSGSDTGYLYGIKAKIVCSHNWEAGAVTDPTCTAEGYTTYTCSKCGDVKHDDAVAALGHDDVLSGSRATCTEAGSVTRICRRCERSLTETEPALGHEKGAILSETDAVWTYRCTRCGESYTVAKAWDGTYTEPKRDAEGAYLIGDASELAWLHRYALYTGETEAADFTTAKIKLTADIYMSGYNWVPPCFTAEAKLLALDGVRYYSGGEFRGSFDGQGHTIHGLTLTWGKAYTVVGRFDSLGLFGRINGAELRDLGLEATFRITDQDAYYSNDNWLNVGGFAGLATASTIERCFVKADFVISKASNSTAVLEPAVGGIAGAVTLGTRIADCYTTGSISAAGTGYVALGGLVGSTRAGANVITRCWSDAALTAAPGASADSGYVGGLVGKVDAISTGALPEISYCFALNPSLTGSGSDVLRAGRVVGYAERFGNEGSYNFALSSMELVNVTATAYDESDSGYRSGWGRDLSAANALLETTYTNVYWNYDKETEETAEVWTFSGDSYPRLRWESADTSAGFDVAVENFAKAETQLTSGSYAGTVRFTLGGEAGCAVLTSTDGETWTALPGHGSYELTVASNLRVRIVLRGDLNADGSINTYDAVRAKRIAAGLDTATELELAILDMASIGGLAALRVQRAAAGLYTFGW